jgi:hypothetical protein
MAMLVYSCIPIYDLEELTCYKKPFDNTYLRYDGYYTYRWDRDTSNSHYIFLFQDGTYDNCGTYPNDGYQFYRVAKKNYTNHMFQEQNSWGVYCIDYDTIKIQTLFLDYVGMFYFHLKYFEERGIILNDTTFKLFEGRDKSEVFNIDRTYHFHQCDCKPDSTNWLKKNKRLNRLAKKWYGR